MSVKQQQQEREPGEIIAVLIPDQVDLDVQQPEDLPREEQRCAERRR